MEIPAHTISYQTMHDCNVDISKLMGKNAARHTAFGICVRTNASALYSDARIVRDISRCGKLSVDLVIETQELVTAATLPARKSTL